MPIFSLTSTALLGVFVAAGTAFAAPNPWEVAPSTTGTPFWSYGSFGKEIGRNGLVAVPSPNGTRLFVSASSTGATYDDYWYVLRYDPETGGYRQDHIHPPYPVPNRPSDTLYIRGLETATRATGSEPVLVVGLSYGGFRLYSTSTYQEVGSLLENTWLTAFRAADLDGDGATELIALTSQAVNVYNLTGDLIWSLPMQGRDNLVVAQMDADPALEIAFNTGEVIDSATRSAQWNAPTAFGGSLRAADIDGDNRSELITLGSEGTILAYDVDTQTEKWSLTTGSSIGTIELANADADPELELLYGDARLGGVHVLNLDEETPVEAWSAEGLTDGVERILVDDLDEDNVPEILWSGESTTSFGGHCLNLVNTATHELEWQSIHLDGPFLSPVVGDVTGDGIPELVTASWESNAGYSSGRILVFDAATLNLLAVSDPVGDESFTFGSLYDLKLRDIDGDGRLEIVTATHLITRGVAQVYRFTDEHTFQRLWKDPVEFNAQTMLMPFSQVEARSVDGRMKIVTGNRVESTINKGVYLKVFDYESRTEEWTSPDLGHSWNGVISMVADDFDGDGVMEVAAVVDGIGVCVYDLATKNRELFLYGSYRSVAPIPGQTGFYLGSEAGNVLRLAPSGGSYAVVQSWKASDQPVTSLAAEDQNTVWVGAGPRIYRWHDGLGPVWSSIDLDGNIRGPLGLLTTGDGLEAYAGTPIGVRGFQLGEATEFTLVDMETSGALAEGTTNPATLRFIRSQASSTPLDVVFTLTGSASAGDDYAVAGATRLSGDQWQARIPANQTTATVTLTALQDAYPEYEETVEVQLAGTADYFTGHTTSGEISLTDDEPVISVTASDPTGSEMHTKRIPATAEFTFHRTGSTNQPLTVRYTIEGSATADDDFHEIPLEILIPAGEQTAKLTIVPRLDDAAEGSETVVLKLQPNEVSLVSATQGSATATILDSSPYVSFIGTTNVKGGVMLSLARSGGSMKAQPITIYLQFTHANGTINKAQRVTFRTNSSSLQYLIRPPAKVQGPVQVKVTLGDYATYFVDGPAMLNFTLP